MSNPQQPELARSRKVPHQDQDAASAAVEARRATDAGGPTGPVPPENQPGHHPPEEQDKPDLDAFAAKLGGEDGVAGSSDRPAPAEAASETAQWPESAPAQANPGPLGQPA